MNNKLDEYIIDYQFISKFSIGYLKKHVIIPLKEEDLYFLVGIENKNIDLEFLINILNKPIKTILFKRNEILQALYSYESKKILYDISIKSLSDDNIKDSNIKTFLDELIKISLHLKSSDIHIESDSEFLFIRVRIDGALKHFITLDKKFLNILSSYIKLKSNLDISLKRFPQDSRFTYFIDERKYDFRVSTMPTIEGESIVLRILENSTSNKQLSNIGFNEKDYKKIKEIINQTSGLILITGPTGSGKTTTLYSMIKELNNSNKKIITIEDPVEYKIPKVQQISINNDIGLSFSKVLSNILRQDPDIILIGEIRDKESLKIAIQASLTGHLVLATLHTNSAINTINRILDLEGEAFLLSSTLKMIISQRLIRKLCNKCKKYDDTSKTYIPMGCEKCNFDGYLDRAVSYELINIDEKISNMIAKGSSTDEIQKYLDENNYKNIKDFTNDLLEKGITSLEEVYKVL